MKSIACFLATACALASATLAGPVTYTMSEKGGELVQPTGPIARDCFGPGAAFGIYGGTFLNNDDAFGGGALAEYFFSDYLGLQASYGIFATDREHHEIDGALVLRYPITSICIAPYLMLGGGLGTNSSTEGNVFAGAGIEARLESVNCVGVFADGAYHWADGDAPDYTIIRLGVKFPF